MNVYPFIEAEKQEQRNVKRACELLRVSRGAYYADRHNGPSRRELEDDELTEAIKQVRLSSMTDTVDGSVWLPRHGLLSRRPLGTRLGVR